MTEEPKRKAITLRADARSVKEHAFERLQALAEDQGRSISSLAQQAIREFADRAEGKTTNQEDLVRLLRATTNTLGAMTDKVNALERKLLVADESLTRFTTAKIAEQTTRIEKLENLVDNINRILCNRGKQNEVFAAVIQKLREQANPEWTQEEKEASWRQLAEPDKDVSTGSLFDS